MRAAGNRTRAMKRLRRGRSLLLESRRRARLESRDRNVAFGSIQASMALAVSLIAASVATAESLPWDQEKVTAIAAELPPATRPLRVSLRQKPPPTWARPVGAPSGGSATS